MKTIHDYTIAGLEALIKDNDALVAMNSELVEALKIAIPAINLKALSTTEIINVQEALTNNRELSHEQ